MSLNKDLTIVFVSFFSKNIIEKPISQIPRDIPIIVVENSKDIEFQRPPGAPGIQKILNSRGPRGPGIQKVLNSNGPSRNSKILNSSAPGVQEFKKY